MNINGISNSELHGEKELTTKSTNYRTYMLKMLLSILKFLCEYIVEKFKIPTLLFK